MSLEKELSCRGLVGVLVGSVQYKLGPVACISELLLAAWYLVEQRVPSKFGPKSCNVSRYGDLSQVQVGQA